MTDPVPSGESETLEERYAEEEETLRHMATTFSYAVRSRDLERSADAIATLRAEVARLEMMARNSDLRIQSLLEKDCARNRVRNDWGQTMADQRNEARAEVARLTAELAEARDELRRECEASEHLRAEAARYREALEAADRDLAEVEDLALGKTVERIAAVRAKVYAALATEGGDRA